MLNQTESTEVENEFYQSGKSPFKIMSEILNVTDQLQDCKMLRSNETNGRVNNSRSQKKKKSRK